MLLITVRKEKENWERRKTKGIFEVYEKTKPTRWAISNGVEKETTTTTMMMIVIAIIIIIYLFERRFRSASAQCKTKFNKQTKWKQLFIFNNKKEKVPGCGSDSKICIYTPNWLCIHGFTFENWTIGMTVQCIETSSALT